MGNDSKMDGSDAYTMYMDESETYNDDEKFFVMSGVIIKDSEYVHIEDALAAVKRRVWDDDSGCENYILHEMDITYASRPANRDKLNGKREQYRIFVDRKKTDLLYAELTKLFRKSNINVMGVCLPKNFLADEYGGKNNLNNQFTVGIQFMVESYCQFLIRNDAHGKICYESMQDNQNIKIQQRVYELMALGTMHYVPHTIQSRIDGIDFVEKTENVAGLQLADFVPNSLGRYAAKMKPRNTDFSKAIRRKLYDGDENRGDEHKRASRSKFGFKVLG